MNKVERAYTMLLSSFVANRRRHVILLVNLGDSELADVCTLALSNLLVVVPARSLCLRAEGLGGPPRAF